MLAYWLLMAWEEMAVLTIWMGNVIPHIAHRDSLPDKGFYGNSAAAPWQLLMVSCFQDILPYKQRAEVNGLKWQEHSYPMPDHFTYARSA